MSLSVEVEVIVCLLVVISKTVFLRMSMLGACARVRAIVFMCLRICLRDSVCKEAPYVCGAVCRVFELAIKFCQGR